MTIRFWYCMEHSKPVVLSLEALRCQVQNLQVNEPNLDTVPYWQKISNGSIVVDTVAFVLSSVHETVLQKQPQKYNWKFQNESHELSEWNSVKVYIEFFIFNVYIISQLKRFGFWWGFFKYAFLQNERMHSQLISSSHFSSFIPFLSMFGCYFCDVQQVLKSCCLLWK